MQVGGALLQRCCLRTNHCGGRRLPSLTVELCQPGGPPCRSALLTGAMVLLSTSCRHSASPTPLRASTLESSPAAGMAAPAAVGQGAPAADASAAQGGADNGQAPGSSKQYRLVNFYHLVDLEQPFNMLRRHREFCEGRDLMGRIYISRQGINAQFSGEENDALEYTRWVASLPEFCGVHWISDPVTEHQFPKLRLKYRENLVQLAGGMSRLPVTQPEARATPLDPERWKGMLREAQAVEVGPDGRPQRKVVVLDVRNGYEWDTGHFKGAERPLEDNFHETPTDAEGEARVPAYMDGLPADTPVMMYCTGGIRCDIYSTYLRSKGFHNLYTLEGGVHNYLRQEGSTGWTGSLFVFDNRMAIPGDSEQGLVAAVPCSCGAAAKLPHSNCANLDCNRLFMACEACKGKYRGCCCEACVQAPRLLRPFKPEGGHYGSWTQYAGEETAGALASGRGAGRTARRRRRQQALKKKIDELRAAKAERRKLVKAAMEERERQEGGADQSTDEQGESGEVRLLRLQALRKRLAALKLKGGAAAVQ